MSGVMREIFDNDSDLFKEEVDFFSVASTIPFVALIPRDVTPCLTALRAYSICTSFPLVGGVC
jgi:hypothetical protein